MNDRVKALISLGRVSNLPTVWTNCLAAMALVGGRPLWWLLAGSILAMSLFYTGGMFLNDAFDREFDRTQRPERPIPSGAISARAVFALGFGQLLAGMALVAALAFAGFCDRLALLSAATLAALILAYNLYHKNNPLSPLLMGLCRVAVYTTVGLLFLPDEPIEALLKSPGIRRLLAGSAVLLCYLLALTFIAKREGRKIPPPVPIPHLIAGICIVDGVLMLSVGSLIPALFSIVGFRATLFLQRWVKGT